MSRDPSSYRIGFTDQVRPDGTIQRSYNDGLIEWRTARAPDRIEWTNSRQDRGVDVDLGGGRVRRETSGGEVSLGQHLGYGVTSWDDGAYVTVNETALTELAPPSPRLTGLAALLSALGLGWLLLRGAAGVPGFGPDEYALYADLARLPPGQRRVYAAWWRRGRPGEGGDVDGIDIDVPDVGGFG